MSFWGLHRKKIALAVVCAVCVAAGGVAVAQARQQTIFDPSRYTAAHANEDANVAFDSALFGGNKQEPGGLELDKTQKEDYALEEGDQNIREEEPQSPQSPQELQIADGGVAENGTGSESGTETPHNSAINPSVLTYNTGESNSTGTELHIGAGQGNAGQAPAGGQGNNGQTPGGTGQGSGNATPAPTRKPTAPVVTPAPSTVPDPEPSPTPTAKPYQPPQEEDDGPFGTDYEKPETVEDDPHADSDSENHVVSTGLTVSGTLRVHFYPGERPRTSEMKKYITVNAKMSNGELREDLEYCQDPAYGGEYIVAWGGGAGDCVGNKPGSYTATISYRGMTYKIQYDIVTWQLTLHDFEEKAPGFKPLVQTAKPGSTPIVNLTAAVENMESAIETRTEEAGYTHVNKKQSITGFECYTEYFGGWAVDKKSTAAVGLGYKMPRPGDAEVVNGVYNIDLYPVWTRMGEKQDGYYVVRNTSGSIEMIGYNPAEAEAAGYDPKLIQVPQGVISFNMDAISQNGYTFGGSVTEVERIELPESVTDVSLCESVAYPFPSLTEFTVSGSNQFFAALDGILYNKTGKKLVAYPEAKCSVAEWSDRVEEIGEFAFANAGQSYTDNTLADIQIPASVTKFGAEAFYNASIHTLELLTTGQMQWGEWLFGNDGGVTVQNLILHSEQLPKLPAGNEVSCLYFCDMWSILLDNAYESITLTVPDSENDRTYIKYLSLMQKHIDKTITQVPGTAYNMLNTPQDVKPLYSCDEGGNILTDGGQTLALAAGGSSAVTVPEGIAEIAPGAFEDCTGLEFLIFRGSTPPRIADAAFGSSIPSGLSIYVPDVAVYKDALRYITSHSDAKVYENGEKVLVKDGNVYLQHDPEDNTCVTLLSWKEDALYANVAAFFTDDWELKTVTRIDDAAFSACANLRAVTLPAEIEQLGSAIFEGCPLRVLAFNGATLPTVATDTFEGVAPACYIPAGSGAAYAALAPSMASLNDVACDGYEVRLNGTDSTALYGNVEVDYGEDGIYPELFCIRYVAGTDKFYMDDSATTVYEGAFENCTAITALSATTQSLWTIEDRAFAGCTALATLDIGTIPTCGVDAFAGCPLLSVTLGDPTYRLTAPLSTDELAPFNTTAFLGMRYSMSELYGSFADWENLTDFSTAYFTSNGQGWTYIERFGDGLFAGCSGMRSFNFADIAPTCGTDALAGCTGFALVVGDSRLDFGNLTTYDLEGFKDAGSVTFCGWADSISGSFADWQYLESFAAEGNIGYVYGSFDDDWNDVGLFEGCQRLSLVTFANVESFGGRTFANCPSLVTVMLNNWNGSVEIPADAFVNCNPALQVFVNYEPYDYAAEAVQPEPTQTPEPPVTTPLMGVSPATPETAATPLPTATAPAATPAPTATAQATPSPTAQPEPQPQSPATPETAAAPAA